MFSITRYVRSTTRRTVETAGDNLYTAIAQAAQNRAKVRCKNPGSGDRTIGPVCDG